MDTSSQKLKQRVIEWVKLLEEQNVTLSPTEVQINLHLLIDQQVEEEQEQ